MGLLLTVRIVVLQHDKDREQLDRLPRVPQEGWKDNFQGRRFKSRSDLIVFLSFKSTTGVFTEAPVWVLTVTELSTEPPGDV